MQNTDKIRKLFPFLNWPKLTVPLLKGEVSAGVTVGLMMIPQCVAYAAVAGMPLVTGVYAALLPAVELVCTIVRRADGAHGIDGRLSIDGFGATGQR
jgi:MFS superfamily sulfate permease-like transporter